MSKYFKTLGRLKSNSWADTAIHRDSASPSQTGWALPRPSETGRHVSILEPELQGAQSIKRLSHLSDGIRALAHSNAAPGAVITGVGNSAPIDAILDQLCLLSSQGGLRLAVAEFVVSEGSRLLRVRSDRPTHQIVVETDISKATANQPRFQATPQLNLSSGWQEAEKWIVTLAKSCDLLLIKAPPVLDLVDGALLAKIAGGLVLVAELHRTSREDLIAAVKRAKASECPILGLVTVGHELSVPKWLTRLFSSVESQ